MQIDPASPINHERPLFEVVKKEGVQLLLPKEWHKMFADIAEDFGCSMSEIINYPLEMGIITCDARYNMKEWTEVTLEHKGRDLALAIVNLLENIMRGRVTPGQMHVKEYVVDAFSSVLEKYGALRMLTTKKPGIVYQTYRIPIGAKEFCQKAATENNTTLTHMILDFIMTGIAMITYLRHLQSQKELNVLDTKIDEIGKYRIVKCGKGKEGGKTGIYLKIAKFEKKKEIPSESIPQEIIT